MNKISVPILLISSVIFSSSALADESSLTVGYAQSKIRGSELKDFRGINLKYSYETDSSLGVMASLTYMGSLTKYFDKPNSEKYYTKLNNISLLVGPVYRVNDYFSIYGLAGMGQTKVKLSSTTGEEDYIIKSTQPVYGLGVTIKPVDHLAINVGYERSRASLEGVKFKINNFNVGLGYRF